MTGQFDSFCSGDKTIGETRLKIFVVTWNTNQSRNYKDLKIILAKPSISNADIIAVGLQEVNRDHSNLITALQFTAGIDHILYAAETFGSIILTVFVKPYLLTSCTDLKRSNIHLRACNCFRTKGSVAIFFRVFGSSFLFLTSHLAAGSSYRKLCKRKLELKKIHDELTLSLVHKKWGTGFSGFDGVDYVFWFGDFNFRLSETRHSVDSILRKSLDYQHLRQDEIQNLLAFDQLTRYKMTTLLHDFVEPDINFLPTYKFDPQSNFYDTSKKQRIPSYTDRIFSRCKNSSTLFCHSYESPDAAFSSDHKPVYASYEIAVLRQPSIQVEMLHADRTMTDYYRKQRKAALQKRSLHQKLSACGCGVF